MTLNKYIKSFSKMEILNLFYLRRKNIKDPLGLGYPIKIMFLKDSYLSVIEYDYIITYCIENGTILKIVLSGIW
jgi:hypothetical protein